MSMLKKHKYGWYEHISPNKYNPHIWIVNEENVTIGDNCWIGAFVVLDGSGGMLKIGKEVSIACGAHIYTHSTAWLHVSEGKKQKVTRKVTIGDYAVIGANAVVVMANIGHHSIVQACSVVLKDVPPHVIVAGNPAKVVKKIA